MVFHVQEGQSSDRWPVPQRQSHTVAAGFVLVAITSATVLIAYGVVPSVRGGLDMLWIVLGAAALLAFVFRLRGPLSRGTFLGAGGSHAPVVIRRNGMAAKSDARRHRRFVPARRSTMLYTHDGRQIAARIIDISIAGVSVEARMTDLEFSAVTRVGSHAAGPVRRTASGAVFGFDALLDPQPFDAAFVL